MYFTILILSVFSKKCFPTHIKFFINKNTKTSIWAEKQAHTSATQKAPHALSLFTPQSSTPGITGLASILLKTLLSPLLPLQLLSGKQVHGNEGAER